MAIIYILCIEHFLFRILAPVTDLHMWKSFTEEERATTTILDIHVSPIFKSDFLFPRIHFETCVWHTKF